MPSDGALLSRWDPSNVRPETLRTGLIGQPSAAAGAST